MDLDVDTALSRVFDTAGDKWESEGKDFFLRIREGYKKCLMLDILKDRMCFIDAR